MQSAWEPSATLQPYIKYFTCMRILADPLPPVSCIPSGSLSPSATKISYVSPLRTKRTMVFVNSIDNWKKSEDSWGLYNPTNTTQLTKNNVIRKPNTILQEQILALLSMLFPKPLNLSPLSPPEWTWFRVVSNWIVIEFTSPDNRVFKLF